jgi:endonuclease/exonuclease/phosphatase family metal-dependent hydrolase
VSTPVLTQPEPAEVPVPPRSGFRFRPSATLCWVTLAFWVAFLFFRAIGFDGVWWPLIDLPAITQWAAVTALVPLALSLLGRRFLAAGVAVLTLAGLSTFVVPRLFGHLDAVRGPQLRVLSANLYEGGADPASLVNLVRSTNADVVALEELTPDLLQSLSDDGLSALMPYQESSPRGFAGGTALFSKYPLSDSGRVRLLNGFVESYGTVSVPGARPVEVTVVHYCAPADPTQMACWRYGVSQVPSATPKGAIKLLVGDFNLTDDYTAFQKILGTGYRDAGVVAGKSLTATWPFDGKPLPPVTLDHVVADRRLGINGYSVHAIKGSDHRAVLASLNLVASS